MKHLKCRATIPALRRLLDVGNILRPDGTTWVVTLRHPVPDLVVTLAPLTRIRCGATQVITYLPAIRLPGEPPFPGETAADPQTLNLWKGNPNE